PSLRPDPHDRGVSASRPAPRLRGVLARLLAARLPQTRWGLLAGPDSVLRTLIGHHERDHEVLADLARDARVEPQGRIHHRRPLSARGAAGADVHWSIFLPWRQYRAAPRVQRQPVGRPE